MSKYYSFRKIVNEGYRVTFGSEKEVDELSNKEKKDIIVHILSSMNSNANIVGMKNSIKAISDLIINL